jgi:hypothetical protein
MFLQDWIDKEHILVEPISLLLARAHILLGSDLQKEVYKLYPEVWVLDLAIQDDRERASKLQMHVIVTSNVSLRPQLFEQFGHAVQVMKDELRQSLEVCIEVLVTTPDSSLLQEHK